MKYCKQCGNALNDDASFCPKCGAKQDSSPVIQETPAAQTQGMPSQTPSSSQTQGTPSQNQPAGKKPLSTAAIIAIILGAIIVIGAVVFFTVIKPKMSDDFDDVRTEEMMDEGKESSGKKDAMPVTEAETTAVTETVTTEAETPEGVETIEQPATEPAIVESAQAAKTEDFEGYWVAQGGRWGIDITNDNGTYYAYEEGSSSYRSGGSMNMTCQVQADDLLHYTDGTAVEYMYDDQGNQAIILQFINGEGWFTLYNGELPQEGRYTRGILAKEWKADGTADQYMVWETEWEPPRASDEYIIWYSSEIYLTEDDVMILNKDELRLARNEIYARHGRKFDSKDLQTHFNSCSWYYGTIDASNFNESVLSDIEKANIKLIESYENR